LVQPSQTTIGTKVATKSLTASVNADPLTKSPAASAPRITSLLASAYR
jgi:hypothetical protein